MCKLVQFCNRHHFALQRSDLRKHEYVAYWTSFIWWGWRPWTFSWFQSPQIWNHDYLSMSHSKIHKSTINHYLNNPKVLRRQSNNNQSLSCSQTIKICLSSDLCSQESRTDVIGYHHKIIEYCLIRGSCSKLRAR